jgi:hypothetical protein
LCRRRFDGAELHLLAHASPKAENLVGGHASDSAIAELSHDLYLAQIALSLAGGGTFLHEDFLDKTPNGVKPDAVLQPGDRSRGTVVEVVGSSYSASRLLKLFQYAAARDLLIRFY